MSKMLRLPRARQITLWNIMQKWNASHKITRHMWWQGHERHGRHARRHCYFFRPSYMKNFATFLVGTATPQQNQNNEKRHVVLSKHPQNERLERNTLKFPDWNLQIRFHCVFSLVPRKPAAPKWMFCARPAARCITCHKRPPGACHTNCLLSPLDVAPTIGCAKTTGKKQATRHR